MGVVDDDLLVPNKFVAFPAVINLSQDAKPSGGFLPRQTQNQAPIIEMPAQFHLIFDQAHFAHIFESESACWSANGKVAK